MKKQAILVVLSALALAGCGEEWEGFVYPNKHDLTEHIGIGISYRCSAKDKLNGPR